MDSFYEKEQTRQAGRNRFPRKGSFNEQYPKLQRPRTGAQTASCDHVVDRRCDRRRSVRWLRPRYRRRRPAVLLAYAAAGTLVVLVMRMLGEMAVASPDTGSFSTYADRAIGHWAGFTIGWLYWWFWVLVIPLEANAAATILHAWFPECGDLGICTGHHACC